MLRVPEAGIHEMLSQADRLTMHPLYIWLYTIVALLYLQLPNLLQTSMVVTWKDKSTVTFSDMLACVRRVIWQEWVFQTPRKTTPFLKLPQALQETILYALAPAA
jgi:hypothetical protein